MQQHSRVAAGHPHGYATATRNVGAVAVHDSEHALTNPPHTAA